MTTFRISDILIFRMNQLIQTTGIIRSRGQLTIPDLIRKNFGWLTPDSVVTVGIESSDAVVIRPYTPTKKRANWNKIWNLIKKCRSFKGSGGSLSEFIVKDRETHF